MKRLISILIILMTIFTLASCGSNSGDSLEDKYYNTAQEYIEKEDFDTALKVIEEGLSKIPDSSMLVELKDKITSEDETTVTTTEEPTTVVPTEESIIKEFTALRTIYRKWFERYEFEYNETAGTLLENYMVKYPVKDATVKSKADLDNLFLKYCNDSLYKKYSESSLVTFKDENGTLYCVMPEAFGFSSTADKDIKVEKLTDTDYQLTYIEDVSDEGDVYSYNVTLAYTLSADGVWRFGTETRTLIEDEAELENVNYNYSAQVTPDGQQIVEEIVGDTLNGIDNLINDIL